ncbi:hypothetical protein H632_c4439p0 [Helicosporidium sp. ATCC 50920]|nr:hypothetical protein H632_c4439p0 [Helicosporidium sp. ATCC 50920]|eukprot:KDD71765.1 hypothetical protein H632_c4439p0 [Helicosporidium sp. ATCC 50920]
MPGRRIARSSYPEEELSDGFVTSEGEESEEDWRGQLREALGGYDPSRYREIDRMDDRAMEVTRYDEIAREEMRSAKIGREADKREEEAEALRQANKRERKAKKRGATRFLDDD